MRFFQLPHAHGVGDLRAPLLLSFALMRIAPAGARRHRIVSVLELFETLVRVRWGERSGVSDSASIHLCSTTASGLALFSVVLRLGRVYSVSPRNGTSTTDFRVEFCMYFVVTEFHFSGHSR